MDNFLSPGYGMNSLSGEEALLEEAPYVPEEDPVMARLTALEEEIMALKESLAAQGITTMPRNIDPWRERARRRLPESPYEGEMPY